MKLISMIFRFSYYLAFYIALGWLLAFAFYKTVVWSIENQITAEGSITIGAQVINPTDPISTVEEPQQSMIVTHQRDLLGRELSW